MPTNAVLSKQATEKITNRTFYETGHYTKKDHVESTIVRVAKQRLPEPQSVTPVIITTKAQSLLHFDPDYERTIERCLPAKGIVKVILHRPFCIFATNIFNNTTKMNKQQVLGRLTDDTDNIVTTDPHISEKGSPLKSTINTVVTR